MRSCAPQLRHAPQPEVAQNTGPIAPHRLSVKRSKLIFQEQKHLHGSWVLMQRNAPPAAA